MSSRRLKRWWMYSYGYGCKIPDSEVNRLKTSIRERLRMEDYRCKLPKFSKPRVRHKLTLVYR